MIQRRRLSRSTTTANPILAVLVAAALVVTAVFGGNYVMKTQTEGQGGIAVQETTMSLSAGESVVIDDPAVATQGDGSETDRTVKQFTQDTEFSMFALTWEGNKDVNAFVRAARADGSWSEWFELDQVYEVDGATKNGTELIYIEPTTKVQVSMGNVDLVTPGLDAAPEVADVPAADAPAAEAPAADVSAEEAPAEEAPVAKPAAGSLPLPTNHGDIAPVADVVDAAQEATPAASTAEDFSVVLMDGGTGTADAIAPMNYEGMPNVITRAGWGANEGIRSGGPYYNEPVEAITVHHTAGSNNYSESQAPGIVRGIYDYHARTLGWGDVGYNAMVDKYGNVYEGRYGGLDRAVQGAHVGGFNQNTWGISVLGNYQTATPTQASIEALGNMAGWRSAVAGFDPTGSTSLTADFDFKGSRYSAGQGDTFPRINAHRDFHYNQCPGDNLYGQMDQIRAIAKKKYTAVSNGTDVEAPEQTDTGSNPIVDLPSVTPGKNTETTTTDDGTTTTVTKDENAADTSSISGLLAGEPEAVAAAAGSVAALAITLAASNNLIPGGAKTVADVEILPGLTVGKLTPYVGTILQVTGNDEAAGWWNTLEPLLGTSNGTAAGVGGAEYAFFDNGIGVRNANGETFALVGKIADAWLQQGLDLGPLGMPVADEYAANNGDMRVDFQGGSISYNANTHSVDIQID
ncbi:N-acetylmuramoyl-L-alanine amidase [Corynebacterium breve]|uniref:N-acetylmuramoyl-L-alanine amidase n=1 Tax=Corynebacterium breve TaxID=3049799 RepID=A0ABY8VGX7_9CORY|nr:N-acetylmuramoyl-L-alanine amidase [Corynebacterium breve]WIM67518.1 N-acetylmuramoyl-L-alanine amidase [Corynebacterium breve]